MPCDTRLLPNQTLTQRKQEVKSTVEAVDRLMLRKKVVPVVDKKTGAVTFTGLTEQDRNRVTDACIYRRIMVSGSALAKMELARAEQLAGRAVNKQAVAQGIHSHNGGIDWHGKG